MGSLLQILPGLEPIVEEDSPTRFVLGFKNNDRPILYLVGGFLLCLCALSIYTMWTHEVELICEDGGDSCSYYSYRFDLLSSSDTERHHLELEEIQNLSSSDATWHIQLERNSGAQHTFSRVEADHRFDVDFIENNEDLERATEHVQRLIDGDTTEGFQFRQERANKEGILGTFLYFFIFGIAAIGFGTNTYRIEIDAIAEEVMVRQVKFFIPSTKVFRFHELDTIRPRVNDARQRRNPSKRLTGASRFQFVLRDGQTWDLGSSYYISAKSCRRYCEQMLSYLQDPGNADEGLDDSQPEQSDEVETTDSAPQDSEDLFPEPEGQE